MAVTGVDPEVPPGLSRSSPAVSPRYKAHEVYYAAAGWWRQRRSEELRRSILISGGPRSGTTWLRDILATLTSFPMMEEPTGLRRNTELNRTHGWGGRAYRDPDVADAGLARDLERVVTGTYLGPGLIMPNRRNTVGLWTRRPMVTKVVDANLLVPWIVTQLPWLRVIEIVRHPFAVAASRQARADSVWAQQTSIADSYQSFMEHHPEYAGPTEFDSPEQAQVAAWAVEHAWLRDNRDRLQPVHWVSYESLRSNTADEANSLARWLGVPDPTDEQLSEMERPSRTTTEQKSTLGASHESGWRARYDSDQIKQMVAILERYDFPFYGPDELELH